MVFAFCDYCNKKIQGIQTHANGPLIFRKKLNILEKFAGSKIQFFIKDTTVTLFIKNLITVFWYFSKKINGDTVIQILYGSKEISGNFCLKARPPKVNLNDRRAETVCEENYKW